MRLLFLLALSLGTYPCVAQEIIDGSMPANSTITIDNLRAVVAGKLKDPKSAQFKLLKYHDNPVTGPVLCGWLNAKNMSGGYSDFFPFYFQQRSGDFHFSTDYNNETLGDLPRLPFVNVGCAINTLGNP